MKDYILGQLRHALTTFGGAWVTSSLLITESEWQTVASAVVILIGAGWSLLDKKKRKSDA